MGGNAQGKTSLLEAIYYFATFSSFHASTDRQLINLVAQTEPLAVARLIGEYERADRSHRIEVRLIQETNGANMPQRFRKEVLLDGVKKKINQVYGHFNAVLFLPQMTRILENSPAERRRYLDELICQTSSAYAEKLGSFSQTLTQRNALLKSLAESGGDSSQLDVWDDMLAKQGAGIIFTRIKTILELEALARRIHHRLTDQQEVLRVDYQPAFDPLNVTRNQMALPVSAAVDRSKLKLAEIESLYREGLRKARAEEIQRGMTALGPHRDEIRFLSNRMDLGDFGSRGQIRTTLMALKIAEIGWIQAKNGEMPVLLLDEMMAELDVQRRKDLLAVVQDCDQAFITATDLDMFEAVFTARNPIWQVKNGVIQAAGDA